MPNTAMAKGSQAVIGTGRRSWIVGSTTRFASRLQPMRRPSGMATSAARPKPCSTRREEYATLSSHVPEYGESIALVEPKIQVCQERSTCAGDGMMPSVTQRSSTAKCHSASSSAGSTSSQGAGSRFSKLLLEAELLRRLSGGLGEEIVRVVLRDLARHVARDDAVVGEEFRDALDRLERHGGIEARGADRLRRDVLRQTGLFGVDLRPAPGVLARELEHAHVGADELLHRVAVLLHERPVYRQHRDQAADGLRAVVVQRRIGAEAVDDGLGAERLPHHRHVDFLALQRLEVVRAAADDVDDLELVVLQVVLLHRGGELEPGDRAGADADALVADLLPVLDVL